MITYKEIWRVTFPIILSLLAQNVIIITDVAFLGRVGEIELGASALAGIFYFILAIVGFGFSTGIGIIIARRNGEENYRRIGATLVQGGIFLVILALFLTFISTLLIPLLSNVISNPETATATTDFLNIRVYGLLFCFLTALIRSFFIGITQTKLLTSNAIVMAISNIVLNYVLIFGVDSVITISAMGIKGAALASVISEGVALIHFAYYFFKQINILKYGFVLSTFKEFHLIKSILALSGWTMLQYFVSLSTWFFFFISIEKLGTEPLAISNIVRSLSSMLFVFVSAFSSTANTLTSNAIGQNKEHLVIPIIKRIIILSSLILIPLLIIFALFPSLPLNLYVDDPVLIEKSITTLWMLLAAYPIINIGFILFNTVMGTGHTLRTLLFELSAITIYIAYVYIIMWHLKVSTAMCWSTEFVYWGIILMLSLFFLRSNKWKKRKV